jgi:predicted transcriptional regulator
MSSFKNFLFKEKPLKLLLSLSEKPMNISQLARKAGTTYSHTLKLLNLLYENDIIEVKKERKEKIIIVTKKGEKILRKLSEFLSIL